MTARDPVLEAALGRALAPDARLDLDLEGDGHFADRLAATLSHLGPRARERHQLGEAAFRGQGLLDGLGSARPSVRIAACRVCAEFQLEDAVPAIAPLIQARDRSVRLAAARALARIGGARATDALVNTLRSRRLPVGWRLLAIAHAAPDLYLEAALADPACAPEHPDLALAAGLRRRPESLAPLRELLSSPEPRARAAAARAVSWYADQADAPALADLVSDPDPAVRDAAVRSLRRFRLPEVGDALATALAEDGLTPSTRITAARLLARIERRRRLVLGVFPNGLLLNAAERAERAAATRNGTHSPNGHTAPTSAAERRPSRTWGGFLRRARAPREVTR